jgi:hypothetical protein
MSDWMRRRRVLAGLAMVASATSLAAGTVSTRAAAAAPAGKPAAPAAKPALFQGPPPAGFNSWQQVMAMQNRLNDAATKITSAAARSGDGLGSITANPLEKAVRVYWKGTMPTPVSGLVAALRAQTSIRVLPARYSQRELLAEERRLTGTAGSQISEAAPLADAGGLRITLRATATARPGVAAAGGVRTAAIPATPRSRVRLMVSYGADLAPAADRYHDSSAFWGGAAVQSSTGVCTTGFAVRRSGETTNKLLTAAHCGANGTVFTTGDPSHTNNLTVGTMRNRNVFSDVGLIVPPAGSSTDGHVYTGAFSSATAPFTSSASMPVGGSQASFVGNLVYGSGARSGYVGPLTVKATNVAADLDEDGTIVHVSPLVKAQRTDLTNAGGNGDSGGPIFSFSSDLTHVIAKGTYSARGGLSTFVTCTGVANVPDSQVVGRHCSYDAYYVSIVDSLSLFSAGLIGA